MLNPEIAEFLASLEQLKAVGCILAAEESLRRLEEALGESSWKGGVEKLKSGQLPTDRDAPWLYLVAEEDYSADPNWAEAVRLKADYFFNVAG